ncbi:DMT family transporter [Celeribacter sp.]|uniref:DMT family transporter n=1 Tax=Celeribacter sp. TaxID=1890673 RepID=UPI003A91BD06
MSASSPSLNRPVAGIAWMAATTINFVMVNVLVKYVGDSLPIFESAFLRFALGLVFLIPFIAQVRQTTFTRRIVKLSVARATFHAFAMVAWFYAMTRIPMAEVTAMNFMNPVYVTLGAVLLFGEKIALPRIMALCVAFLGGVVILRPGLRELDSGHLAMVFSALFFSGSYLLANALSKDLPAAVVVFLMSAIVPFVLLPFALADWVVPSWHDIGLLFFTAFFATAAHYCMTRAFSCAPQAVLQPVTFVQLVWATIVGYFLFGEGVDVFVLIGGAMIIGAVTFITWREARRKRRL